jgi:glycosyltransferase involved in cell wall biosynthesis
LRERTLQHVRFIADDEVEIYFKSADILVLPYTQIFQSGLPFLSYSFGLPVIASDVGALREDVVDGINGIVCRSMDPEDLASALHSYFSSDLYADLENCRPAISARANAQYSWSAVAGITCGVYQSL